MKVNAHLISTMQDNKTWCRPTAGYKDDPIAIDIEQYEEVGAVDGELSESDHKWPQGAPIEGYVRVDGRVLRKKTKT